MSKRKHGFAYKVGHFFRHYFGLLLLAIICATATVLLVGYCM